MPHRRFGFWTEFRGDHAASFDSILWLGDALLGFCSVSPLFAAWGFPTSRQRAAGPSHRIHQGRNQHCLRNRFAFYIANLVRANLLVEAMRFRADGANLVVRFHASGSDSL